MGRQGLQHDQLILFDKGRGCTGHAESIDMLVVSWIGHRRELDNRNILAISLLDGISKLDFGVRFELGLEER